MYINIYQLATLKITKRGVVYVAIYVDKKLRWSILPVNLKKVKNNKTVLFDIKL